MTYPHTLTIKRETSGSYNDDGVWVPGGNETVYDGKCDFQDSQNWQGLQFSSDAGDVTTRQVDGQIYLKDESAIIDIEIGDTGTVNVLNTDMKIAVKGKRTLDGVLAVDYQ